MHNVQNPSRVSIKIILLINVFLLCIYSLLFTFENYTSRDLILWLLALQIFINSISAFSTKVIIRIPLMILSVTMFTFVYVPMYEILFKTRGTLLEKIRFTGVFDDLSVIRATLLICLSYTSYIIGILKISNANIQTTGQMLLKYRRDAKQFKSIWGVLSFFGLIGFILASVGGFGINVRAEYGNGVIVFLLHGWMTAPAIAVIFKHWGRASILLISLFQLTLLIQVGGARSSLTLLFIAVVVRIFESTEEKSKGFKVVIATLLTTYVALIVIQSVPILRSEVRTNSITFSKYSDILKDPFSNISKVSGLDSVQGAILAINAKNEGFRVSIFDPLKALSSFVPRQIWPSKPNFIGPILTQTYSQIRGNAGIVISGAAYLYLMGGSILFVIVLFLLLGVWTKRLLNHSQNVLAPLYILHFAFRFVYGGDAFDIFFILQDALIILIAKRVSLIKRRK